MSSHRVQPQGAAIGIKKRKKHMISTQIPSVPYSQHINTRARKIRNQVIDMTTFYTICNDLGGYNNRNDQT